MNEKKLQQCFAKHEAEYIKFDNIPDAERRHRRPDLCALIYLDVNLGGPSIDAITGAGHEEIFLCWDNLEDLTEEDILYITRCGVRYDEERESLAMFV